MFLSLRVHWWFATFHDAILPKDIIITYRIFEISGLIDKSRFNLFKRFNFNIYWNKHFSCGSIISLHNSGFQWSDFSIIQTSFAQSTLRDVILTRSTTAWNSQRRRRRPCKEEELWEKLIRLLNKDGQLKAQTNVNWVNCRVLFFRGHA